jgi:branched-chain amino acid transport system permease protein
MEVIAKMEPTERREKPRKKWAIWAGLLVLLILLPLFITGTYYRHIVIFTLMYVVLAQAWNLIGGYAGQIALGNAVFFSIGAYTSSVLLVRADVTPWLGMLVGGVFSAVVSLALGYVVLRLQGHYFAMATIAFNEIVRICFANWRFVGGAQGISVPLHMGSLYHMEFTTKVPYYYIMLFMAVFITVFVYILDRSRFGFYAKAVKQDEIAARNRGISSFKLKQVAFALNAFFTAWVGTFYAQYVLYISPDSVLLTSNSILIAVIAIVGGFGTVSGPILGATFVFPLTEFLRAYLGGQAMGLNYILFGAAAIFVVLVEPNGFVALLSRIRRSVGSMKGQERSAGLGGIEG